MRSVAQCKGVVQCERVRVAQCPSCLKRPPQWTCVRPGSVLSAFAAALTASTLPDLATEPMDAVRRRVMIGAPRAEALACRDP